MAVNNPFLNSDVTLPLPPDDVDIDVVLPDGRSIDELDLEEGEEVIGMQAALEFDVSPDGVVEESFEVSVAVSDFYVNLADELGSDDDSQVLDSLASDLIGEFDEDLGSRKVAQTYVDGLELFGVED